MCHFRAALLIPFLAISLATKAEESASETKIRDCFKQYRTALLNTDGAAAAETVNAATIAYYENMRDLSLSGDKAAVEKQSLINRMMIFSMRLRMDPKELAAMNGKRIVGHAVNKGWISQASVARASLGKIAEQGNTAKAEFAVDGKASGFFILFSNDGAEWKFDLTSLFAPGELALKNVIEQQGKNENAFLFEILESATGKKVSEDVWKPLIQK